MGRKGNRPDGVRNWDLVVGTAETTDYTDGTDWLDRDVESEPLYSMRMASKSWGTEMIRGFVVSGGCQRTVSAWRHPVVSPGRETKTQRSLRSTRHTLRTPRVR